MTTPAAFGGHPSCIWRGYAYRHNWNSFVNPATTPALWSTLVVPAVAATSQRPPAALIWRPRRACPRDSPPGDGFDCGFRHPFHSERTLTRVPAGTETAMPP